MHDQITIGYPDDQKTINLIVWNYYWPGLKKMVRYYIKNCYTCRYTKALKD